MKFSQLHQVVCVLLTVTSFSGYECAHILFIHQIISYSHIKSTLPIANALVAKGHEVTYISPLGPNTPSPRINFIVPEQMKSLVEYLKVEAFDVGNRIQNSMPLLPIAMPQLGFAICEKALTSPEFQEWINTNPKVDFVFGDNVHECAVGLAHKLKAKVGIFSAGPFWARNTDLFGLPDESNAVQSWTYTFPRGKTPLNSFFARVENAILPLFEYFYGRHYGYDKHKELFQKSLKTKDVPDISELEKNISLVLMGGNLLSEHQRCLPPMFVYIGGTHVKDEVDPLDKELEGFISSNSSEGFVYISFGTVARASQIPKNIREIFMKTITEFPTIRFLWRWDGEFPADKPDNLYLSKWFQQQDVLGHPKIKAFITQAGRPSLQEALAKGVPMITIPILADQDINSIRLEEIGVSVNLEIAEMTGVKLKDALNRVFNDERLHQQVSRQSAIFKDQPMKPVETAVWWIEYVLRHDDVSHLKPLGRNQWWFQRRLLDAWAFLLACLLATIILMGKILLVVWNLIRFRRNTKSKLS